jgi:hypothetical protein
MNIPAKKAIGQVSVEREVKETRLAKRGGTYPVGGKDEPDAWRVQEEANEHRINTTIVKAEQNDDMAMVITRSCTETNCVDDVVIHHFSTIFQKQAKDYLKTDIERISNNLKPFYFVDVKNPYNPDGTPILTPKGTIDLISYIIDRKTYAIRDATSKSMRRSQLKIMNKDWREEPEIEMEREEVQDVTNSIKENNKPNNIPKQEKQEEPKKPVKRIAFPDPVGASISGISQSEAVAVDSDDVEESERIADELAAKSKKLEGQGEIKTIEHDKNDKRIKPDNLANETILGPNATPKEMEQAADEIREQMVAEMGDDRLKFLQQVNPNELTESQRNEINALQNKLREKGLKQAEENLKNNPNLPDYKPKGKNKIVQPKGRKGMRVP